MAVRNRETDYLYASARIRAMENTLIGRERLNALAELKSVSDILAALAPYGLHPTVREDGSTDTEGMLTAMLEEGFAAAEEACPDSEAFAFLKYPYDCNNIKSILKCTVRGISPDAFLVPLGTVEVERLKKLLAEDKTEGIPSHMAAAIFEAKSAYAKTKNPQEFDLCLDRACFADMAMRTKDFPFARTAVEKRADLTNILICQRLLRMGATFPMRAAMKRALVPGGLLAEAFFLEAFDGGEAHLSEMLGTTPYAALLDVAGERTLAALEKRADDLYLDFIKTARYVPFGAEVPVAFLAGLEVSVKNLRILLAGKKAGLSPDTVRERMRESYV